MIKLITDGKKPSFHHVFCGTQPVLKSTGAGPASECVEDIHKLDVNAIINNVNIGGAPAEIAIAENATNIAEICAVKDANT